MSISIAGVGFFWFFIFRYDYFLLLQDCMK